MTDTKTVTKEMLNDRFAGLGKLTAKYGPEAQARVAAHIRAITDGAQNSLPMYHVRASIPMAGKYEEYARIAEALGFSKGADGKPSLKSPDWSKLQGQIGQGAKKVEEEEPARRADPLDHQGEAPSRQQAPAESPVVKGNMEPPTHEVGSQAEDDLAAAIVRAVQGRLKSSGNVDEGRVRLIVQEELSGSLHDEIKKANSNGAFPTDRVDKLIKDALATVGVHRIELVQANGELKQIEGLVHPQVPQAATWLNAGVPVWAWSAAGSGKTHSSRQIAEIIGVTPYVISVDPTLTVSKLLGYRNVANGDFVEGYIYKAFRDGGLVALDEVDTGDPGVVASINALLSNTHYLFPNGETVERHPKFFAMAMANTKGTGAVAGYTARNKLDAATLDRFAVIEWKYDAGLETALACGIGSPAAPWKGCAPASQDEQKTYVEWVQKVRAQVGNSVLISPRASINGCKALRAGVPMAEVIDALVFKLVSEDTRKRIVDTCSLPATCNP